MSVKHRTFGLRVKEYHRIDEDHAWRTMIVPIPPLPGALTWRKMARVLQASGEIPETGCGCSHCLMDWDCCGNMFLAQVRVVRISRRRHEATLMLRYARNI